jgi:hypothetical protein
MRLIVPDNIKALKKIYKPYIKSCGYGLVDDAPAEAVEAYSKFREWFDKQHELL